MKENFDEEKVDLRILKTRNVLYHSLEELMKNKAFEEIKVSDICNKALINRSTFYAHYSDKYELLAEYINSLKDALRLELEKNSNIKNSREYYIEMIKLLLNHIEEKKDTYIAIMINNKNSITMDILYDVINKTIFDQMKDGKTSKKIPMDIILKFYLGGVLNVCIEWLKYNNKHSKQEIIDYIDLLVPKDFDK